jgi:hypothetical protein
MKTEDWLEIRMVVDTAIEKEKAKETPDKEKIKTLSAIKVVTSEAMGTTFEWIATDKAPEKVFDFLLLFSGALGITGIILAVVSIFV